MILSNMHEYNEVGNCIHFYTYIYTCDMCIIMIMIIRIVMINNAIM